MACNSVAVSSAQVSAVAMDKQTLIGMLASLTGQPIDGIVFRHWDVGDKVKSHGRKYALQSGYDIVSLVTSAHTVSIQQKIDTSGEITLSLQVSGGDYFANTRAQEKLQPAFDRLVVQGQQATVLKRLAQLGKLSNVKEVDGGVVARITVEI